MLGHFLFWDTFDFGSLLILVHFCFWVTFDFKSLLILGHFWFWVTLNFLVKLDFRSPLILSHFWFWVTLYFGSLWIWNQWAYLRGVCFLIFCDLRLILSFWILRGNFLVWFFSLEKSKSCRGISGPIREGSVFWHFVIWGLF